MIPRALFTTTCAALALGGLGACTVVPDLPGRDDPTLARADYPGFLTIGQLRAVTSTDPTPATETATPVEARAAALQDRAQRLKTRRVVDDEARARLDGATAPD